MYSKEHITYLKKKRNNRIVVFFCQIMIIILLICLWEVLAQKEVINTFLYSSPSKVLNTIVSLYKNNDLFSHIFVTFYETIFSFLIAGLFGLLVATICWWNKTLSKIIDPYLTILNSLPKVALGPLIIIWVGANVKSIIFMAFLIIVFNTIINMYSAFSNTDENKIIVLKSFKATKWQIFTKLIIRENKESIINTLKINIGMSLIGLLPPVGEKIFFNKCYSRY